MRTQQRAHRVERQLLIVPGDAEPDLVEDPLSIGGVTSLDPNNRALLSAELEPIAEGLHGYSLTVARLEDYSFGRVIVDGSEQTRDLIVLPDRVVTNWWRRDGHSLAIEDLDGVLDELPERLILGIGAYGRLHPDPGVIAALERRGVAVECLHTDDAVRRFAEVDERRTAAALHLTC